MAQRDSSRHCINSVASGGEADMPRADFPRSHPLRSSGATHSMQHGYAGHWMDFHPLRMIRIADIRPDDSDTRAHRRNND